MVEDKTCIPCIYLITNKINGKQYIGQTTNPMRRWNEHRAETDEGEGYAITAAFRKYGAQNFTFHIIEQPPIEELNEAEIWWIAHQKSNGIILYNETEGGYGIRGYSHTQKTRDLISDKRNALIASGWITPKHTKEWKTKISARIMGHKWNVGKKHKPDCGHCAILRERNANNNPALNMTQTTKDKMRDKKLGSKNNNAIMTEETVLELRKLASEGVSNEELALKFGISVRNVKEIKERNSWKHI
jgi:group I intron endonuclease